MATHSSVLAWRIPGTGVPGWFPSMGSQRVGHFATQQQQQHVRLFATSWTIACQAPLSMGFLRQEYWNGEQFPSPGDLPHPGMEPGSLALQADSLWSEPQGSQGSLQSSYFLKGWGKEFWRPAGTSQELGVINLIVHFFFFRSEFFVLHRMVRRTQKGQFQEFPLTIWSQLINKFLFKNKKALVHVHDGVLLSH